MEHKAPESERAMYLNLKSGPICRKKRLSCVSHGILDPGKADGNSVLRIVFGCDAQPVTSSLVGLPAAE